MSIIPPIGAGEVSTGFYNNVVQQSLRADDGDNPLLSKSAFSSAGNRKTWTLSIWFKRANLVNGALFSAPINSSLNGFGVYFDADQLVLFEYKSTNQASYFKLTSSAFLRDTTNWYHFVAVFDTNSSGGGSSDTGASARVRMYLNGRLMDVSLTGSIGADYQSLCWNNTYVHEILNQRTSTFPFDGYIAEVNFIDGTAVGHTQVGDDYILNELGQMKNNVWIPKDPTSLTYGTNGFRLQFKQTGTGTASTSTIGADTANSHHFTSTNLNDYDSNILDCPENNWCNFNRIDTSLDGANDMQFGNLAVQSSTYSTVGTNFAFKSGKWYFEFKQESTTGSIVWYVGILQTSRRKKEASNAAWGEAGTASRIQPGGAYALYYDNGTEYKFKIDSYATKTTTALSGHPDVTGGGTSVGGGVVVGILIDMDSNPNTLKYNVDGANLTTLWSENFAFTIADDVTNIYAGQSDEFQVAVNIYQNRLRFNFGQDSTFAGTENKATNADANGHGNFHSAVPSGYLALCSANLPDPTISPHLADGNQAEDFFKTVLYEGNGSARNITVGFQPDWIWFKNRDNSYNHVYYDSVRGPQLRLEPSQSSSTETTKSTAVTDFTPSGVQGFTIGDEAAVNQSGYSIVAWCWKLGGEPTADNSAGVGATPTSGSVKIDGSNKSDALAGTIAATRISANTQCGISIVTYTGNGTDGATVAHGLSKAPETVIVIGRNIANSNMIGTNGHVTGFTHYASYANASGYFVDDDGIWNDTAPTSTVFSIGEDPNTNDSGGSSTYVAICMHHVDGFSRVGELSYAGNGDSTNGTFVHCGFKPAFVMVKKADGTGSWQVYDHLRTSSNSASDNGQQFNPRDERLPLDASSKGVDSSQAMDFASSGFRLRSGNTDQNGGSVPYFFMAFAQMPFKYSNAE